MDSDKYPTILHIDIDAFFASVEEALFPALRGKPVIVGGLPNDRGVVSCPNYEARKLGVRTAMPLSKAYALAPNAVFMRGSYRAYEKYSRRFIEILQDFSPAVRAVSLDEAFLDADGCLHFWDYDPRALALAIKRRVRDELNITVSIGIASNRVCAKVASDHSKKVAREEMDRNELTGPPNGLLVVPLGKEREFLAPLPVSAIPGIGRRTTEALQSLGIMTVDTLSKTDVGTLQKIFGTVGVYLHDAANGKGGRAVDDDNRHAKSISRSTTFSEDSNDEEFISSVFFYLSEKIARELRGDREAASTVTIRMRYSDGAPLLGYRNQKTISDRRFVTYQKSYTLNEATDSEFEIASAGFALFKSLWLRGMKVRLIGIGVSNIRIGCVQPDLFSADRTKRASLLNGLDRIRGKFGYHSVYFGVVDQLDNRYEESPHGFDLHSSPRHAG
jgi:DNA polymerase IV